MAERRFFIDHGVIHDRATGKHVRTGGNVEGSAEDGIEECCRLLNDLERDSTVCVKCREQYLRSAGWWRSASGQDPKDDRWSLGGVHSNTPHWERGSRWLMQPHVAGPFTLHEAVEDQRHRDEVPVGGPKPRGARKTSTKRTKAR
jgi:hypothetical protein